jgi:hypothetical protein
MKKQAASMLMVLAMVATLGCVTPQTTTTPPPGCEGSWLFANQPTVNLILSVAVTGLHVMSTEKPAYYVLASASAKQLAALLREKPVSLAEFSLNPYLTAFAPLFALIPVDRVLCPWEREYLAAYFEMV